MTKIFDQQTEVTSKFDETLFIEGLKAALGSQIFKHLINHEVSKLTITVTMHIPEDED